MLLSRCVFTLVLLAPSALALPEDIEQPVEIVSDQAELDEARGVAIYTGNVRMQQGTLIVTAATLTIQTTDDVVTRVVAEGDQAPATLVQQLEPGPATDPDLQLRGRAGQITYLTEDAHIELKGKAALSQATDRFEGERIDYDLRKRRITANARDGGRMTFTLNPARLRRNTEPD